MMRHHVDMPGTLLVVLLILLIALPVAGALATGILWLITLIP